MWSESAEQSFNEADRVVLYLAVFGLAVLAPGRMYKRWMDGMAAGIAAVGIVALASRLSRTSSARPKRLRSSSLPRSGD